MKGRESKGPPSADLLVCFPSRAHLTLMPKPICSPARPSEPSKRHHNHNHHHHHLKKSSTRGGGGQASSPLLWAKTKPMGSEISEPTSPKVTCAGQIKVRPKASSCKNWQSVMEEIERLHNNRKHKKKRANWVENLGFKKDVMQFLTCLRRIRFDFRCFGSFPTQGLTSDDEEEEEEEEQQQEDFQLNQVGKDGNDGSESSRTVFSKWFMVLQEEQNINNRVTKEESKKKDKSHKEEPIVEACVPPPNALLLMRCRSAPAKTWLEEREHKDEEEKEDENESKLSMEEGKRSKSLAAVMRWDTDFYDVSSDMAKETWVNVGGLTEPLSRSRSWKR